MKREKLNKEKSERDGDVRENRERRETEKGGWDGREREMRRRRIKEAQETEPEKKPEREERKTVGESAWMCLFYKHLNDLPSSMLKEIWCTRKGTNQRCQTNNCGFNK